MIYLVLLALFVSILVNNHTPYTYAFCVHKTRRAAAWIVAGIAFLSIGLVQIAARRVYLACDAAGERAATFVVRIKGDN